MKKVIHIFILVLTGLFLLTTCKNPKIDYESFSITKEIIKPEIHKVVISGEFDLIGEVSSMKLNMGQNEKLIDAESYLMNIGSQSFSVTVDSLSAGSLYYYCYVVEFIDGYKMLTETDEFTTLSDKPLVRTLEVTAVDSITFQVKSIIDDDFGMAITERGICWNHTGNPSLDDHRVAHQENGIGEYTCQISGLELNTTYFVRAYAKNDMGTSYANEVLGFKTDNFEMPTVETLPISDLTQTSVLCGGRIENEGSSPITERGIRWGVTPNPNIDGEFLPSNSNEDDFHVSLTGLTQSTIYYYCAYATNNEGIGYGDVIEFTTLNPNMFSIVVSSSPNEGGQTTGGGEFEEGDVCTVTATPNNHYVFNNWTEGSNVVSTDRDYTFTVNNNRTLVANFTLETYTIKAVANNNGWGTVTGGGTYPYNQSCTLTATPNEGYDFKNWTDNNGTVVSSDNPFSFVVTGNRELVANFIPQGGIKGLYSVSHLQKVYFSKGNLQYKAYPFGTWQFAEHQWNTIGSDNGNISNDYNGWIDLFGWGTGEEPTNTGTINVYKEWGENLIANGGNTPGLWRTLTQSEWDYVFNGRDASTIDGVENTRYVKATVYHVQGIILFPDVYENSSGIDINPNTINTPEAGFDNNIYKTSEWSMMEDEGCVFLPITGYRDITMIYDLNKGFYWSSTRGTGKNAYGLQFDDSSIQTDSENALKIGESVRLVHDYQ